MLRFIGECGTKTFLTMTSTYTPKHPLPNTHYFFSAQPYPAQHDSLQYSSPESLPSIQNEFSPRRAFPWYVHPAPFYPALQNS